MLFANVQKLVPIRRLPVGRKTNLPVWIMQEDFPAPFFPNAGEVFLKDGFPCGTGAVDKHVVVVDHEVKAGADGFLRAQFQS